MLYYASFRGRQVGALGIFYDIHTLTEGEDGEEAQRNLYNRYEHISRLTLTPIEGAEAEYIRKGMRYQAELMDPMKRQ